VAASWAGHRWGLAVEVFVPRTTPQTKVAKIKRYGATLRLVGDNYDQAYAAARHEANLAGGKVWVDSCSDPLAVAGHGTIGSEILAALPDVDDILVPIGGGGLISGIGTAVRAASPAVQITGVQTAACPAMLAAIQDQAFYEIYPAAPSICEALIGGVGVLGFQEHRRLINRVVLAAEESIERAVVDLLRHEQVLAEPSGAVPCAYIMEQPAQFAGRRVVAVCSGQNIDFGLLQRLLVTLGGPSGTGKDASHAC
jgi:threonine dehydratase